MVDTPEKIWANGLGCYGTTGTDGIEYTRSDLVAELEPENERLKLERDAANADRDRWYESSFRATQRAEALSRTGAVNELARLVERARELVPNLYDSWHQSAVEALADHPRDTNTVEAHETADMSDKPVPPELNIRELISDIESGRADGFLNDGTDPHGNDLNCPHCGGSGHIDDVNPTPPEGQQEAVAYIKEVLRIFGQGCTNAGPTSPFGGNPADCDECLTAAAMSILSRPSEQAVTEAMVEALKEARSVIYDTQQSCLYDDDDGQVGVTEDAVISPYHFQKICNSLKVIDNALKAAMEPKP